MHFVIKIQSYLSAVGFSMVQKKKQKTLVSYYHSGLQCLAVQVTTPVL